jgi:polygalacturonase
VRWTRIASFLLNLALLSVGLSLQGQDTRTVSEPHFPKTCTVLSARLAAPGGTLAEAAENMADTERLQSAIDRCTPGKAVELKAAGTNQIFLTAPIRLKPGVTLLIDANTALFGSRNPRDYDLTPGSCGIVGEKGHGCKSLILAEDAPGSGIMGDGAIDARGGAKLLGQDKSWWDLAKEAKIYDKMQSVPRLLDIHHSNNFVLYRITLRNSPNLHVAVGQSDGFTAWGVKILTPKTARNTDGIDPSSSTNITIRDSYISTGDDNVCIKSSSKTGPASHMTIVHNHFYSGHGMSIGSQTSGGVSAIRVSDLTLDGTDDGVRIKSDPSRGGLVQDVVFENVCMRQVANPIVLNSLYTTFPGKELPVYRDITLKDVHSLTPGYSTVLGMDTEHKVGVTFDNVTVDGLQQEDIQAQHAEVTVGPRRGNFLPGGDDVSVKNTGAAGAAPLSCENRFVDLPQVPTAPAAAVTAPPEDQTLYVAADGTGDYYSIQRAIDVAPEDGAVISVAPGVYRESLTIKKANLHLRGPYTDATKTVIVFDKSAGTAGGTLNSATVNVTGDNFLAENLTIQNDFNTTHPQLPKGSQALALLVTGDRAVFRNVRFLGNQDTLYAGSKNCNPPNETSCMPARQYFSNCYIEGNVDFIFGDGKAFFDHCEIHSNRKSGGYITAQGKHYADEDSAFVFDGCKLTAEPGVSDVWLGRPWRPYAAVIMLNTEMGPEIVPAGWREWHPGETNYIETVYYAEYNSTGPGAAPAQRDPHTRHLSAEQAAQFELKRFLAGTDHWEPNEKH